MGQDISDKVSALLVKFMIRIKKVVYYRREEERSPRKMAFQTKTIYPNQNYWLNGPNQRSLYQCDQKIKYKHYLKVNMNC